MNPTPCMECLNSRGRPGSESCRACYTLHYLLPILAEQLRKLKIEITPIIPWPRPSPGPDPVPFLDLAKFEGGLVRAFAGDPEPEPNIFSNEIRLTAVLSLKQSLIDTVNVLDKQIGVLKGIPSGQGPVSV